MSPLLRSAARPTRSVTVAAGMGRRLMPFTDAMPKCLVPVRGRPMLVRQLDAFRAHGVTDHVVVRGYKADVLEARRGELGGGVRFVENREYETNNILQSLFKAEPVLDRPFLFTYADIVFSRDVVRRLMDATGDVCLVVDREYAKVYEGRSEHPLEEAEVTKLKPNGDVALVGKRACKPEEAIGEFIGLAKFSDEGARVLRATWRRLVDEYAGRDEEPFQRAKAWRNAYLTDLLQHLIDAGVQVTPVFIRGEWREIDTTQDLERAEQAVEW